MIGAVNDAPALKRADVGIAVEGATDAAQAAADIVFTEPGLSTMITAIILSREIFQRMKNYVIYRVACTLQLVFFFFIASLAFHPSDFTPEDTPQWPQYFKIPVLGLVFITILNDGTIISIAYDRVVPHKNPEKWALPELFVVSTVLGAIAVASSLLMLWLCLDSFNSYGFLHQLGLDGLNYSQVMMAMYLKVSLSDFFTVFAARTHRFCWSRIPGLALVGAFTVATVCSTLLSRYWEDIIDIHSHSHSNYNYMRSLHWDMIGFIWAYCAIWFLIQDLAKVITYKFMYSTGISTDNIHTATEMVKKEAMRAARTDSEYVTTAHYLDRDPNELPPPLVDAVQRIDHLETVIEKLTNILFPDGDVPPEFTFIRPTRTLTADRHMLMRMGSGAGSMRVE
ncbi:hypothetical protein CYMTET_51554 [Cymbomonas tetramitiformis]|uniref:Uncharacterized protein n=1 Tax=Cymbomonas tetramitiformis TaxID=36881 RepID=A0AAE0ES80_9CHLO|nr:hypothetical protein CYMTET_51554 [Cymbomonas tetramitiformis]